MCSSCCSPLLWALRSRDGRRRLEEPCGSASTSMPGRSIPGWRTTPRPDVSLEAHILPQFEYPDGGRDLRPRLGQRRTRPELGIELNQTVIHLLEMPVVAYAAIAINVYAVVWRRGNTKPKAINTGKYNTNNWLANPGFPGRSLRETLLEETTGSSHSCVHHGGKRPHLARGTPISAPSHRWAGQPPYRRHAG